MKLFSRFSSFIKDRFKPFKEENEKKQLEAGLLSFIDRVSSWFAVFHPDVTLVSMVDPRYTVIRIDKQEIIVDFSELYLWYLDYPECIGSVLEEFINEAKQELRNRPIPPFEDIIEFIFPQVRTIDFLKKNSPRFGKGRLARIEIAEDLFTLFVMDEDRGMTFINNGYMEAWQVNPGSLYNIAIKNLITLGKRLDDSMRIRDDSGYAASHILILDKLLDLDKYSSVFVGIPHRDLLMVFPNDLTKTEIITVKKDIEKSFILSSRPISSELFIVKKKISGGLTITPEKVAI